MARYWVGGSTTWNGTAASKWSTTSGGAGGAAEPTSADDVYLDAASGAVTVTLSAGARTCRSLILTGFAGTIDGSGIPNIYGSWTAPASGFTDSRTGHASFLATTTGHTITQGGYPPGGP